MVTIEELDRIIALLLAMREKIAQEQEPPNSGGSLMVTEMAGLKSGKRQSEFTANAIREATSRTLPSAVPFWTVGNLVEHELGVRFPGNQALVGEDINVGAYTKLWVHPFLRVAVKAAELFYYPSSKVTALLAFEESVKYWRKAVKKAKDQEVVVTSLASLEKIAASEIARDARKRKEG